MPHKSKAARNRYNSIYQRNNPARDFYSQLAEMGTPREIKLSQENGYICEELPICRKPVCWELRYKRYTVRLCAEGYKRWKDVK